MKQLWLLISVTNVINKINILALYEELGCSLLTIHRHFDLMKLILFLALLTIAGECNNHYKYQLYTLTFQLCENS